jgi:DnaJ-class molecular chaperone
MMTFLFSIKEHKDVLTITTDNFYNITKEQIEEWHMSNTYKDLENEKDTTWRKKGHIMLEGEMIPEICHACKGVGIIDDEECPVCMGDGVIYD